MTVVDGSEHPNTDECVEVHGPRSLIEGATLPVSPPVPSPTAPTFFSADEWDAPVVPVLPELIQVDGGRPLLFTGQSHLLFGHGGDGKSYVCASWLAETVKGGGTGLWVDYESDRDTLRMRLRGLGVTSQHAARIAYWRVPGPLGAPRFSACDKALADFLATHAPDLSVLDSVARALNVAGVKESDNDEQGVWWQRLVRAQWELRDLTFVALMHLGHENEHTKDRLAPRGASSSIHQLTGAAYRLNVKSAFSQDVSGELELVTAKCRYGARKKGEVAARAAVDVDENGVVTAVLLTQPTSVASSSEFRPTGLMEKLSRWLECHGEAVSWRMAREAPVGQHGGKANKPLIDRALQLLRDEGFIDWPKGKPLSHLLPYRQTNDPTSDKYESTSSSDPF